MLLTMGPAARAAAHRGSLLISIARAFTSGVSVNEHFLVTVGDWRNPDQGPRNGYAVIISRLFSSSSSKMGISSLDRLVRTRPALREEADEDEDPTEEGEGRFLPTR
jgi:hypothetical protein